VTDGAASVSDSDTKAPTIHGGTTQREKRVKRDLAAEQPPPPSPSAASQRQFSTLYAVRRQSPVRSHSQPVVFASYSRCIGEQYAATGQSRVISFRTDDMASTRDWKAMPTALDSINQPTISFTSEIEGQRANPLTDGSSGVGPINGIEP
jgi:hypothetical protein